MFWMQYALLWATGVLLGVAAFTGRARGFASLLGVFVWFVLGNSSVAVEFFDPAGSSQVASSVAIAWLCYGVAAVLFVVLLLTLHELLTDDESLSDLDDLGTALDPSAVDGEPDFNTNE